MFYTFVTTLLLFLFVRSGIASPRNIIYIQSLYTEDPSEDSAGTHISLLPLIDNDTQVTHVILATVALDRTNATLVTLNGIPVLDPAWDWLWNETSILQDNGVKVSIMLGGAGSLAYNLLQQNFEGYYPPFLNILQYTGVNGVDLDIELRLPSVLSMNTVLELLNSIAQDMGDDFIITMAPVPTDFTLGQGLGPISWNYSVLDAAAVSSSKANGKLVDWYNVQFYDGYGDPGNTTLYGDILQKGWDGDRIVLGLATYDLEGWYPLTDYQAIVQDLVKEYPDFGGVDGWEYGLAGLDEPEALEPWEWVAGIGTAVFGD